MTDIFRTITSFDFYRDPNYLFHLVRGVRSEAMHLVEKRAKLYISHALMRYSETDAKPRAYSTLLVKQFMQLINGGEINENGSFNKKLFAGLPPGIFYQDHSLDSLYLVKRNRLGLTISQGKLLQDLEDGVANFDEFYKIWDNLGTYLSSSQIEENKELIGKVHHVVASLRGNTKAPKRPYIDDAIANANIHKLITDTIDTHFTRFGIRRR